MKYTQVVVREGRKLTKKQIVLLNLLFSKWKRFDVAKEWMSVEKQKEMSVKLAGEDNIVFISHPPLLYGMVVAAKTYQARMGAEGRANLQTGVWACTTERREGETPLLGWTLEPITF